MAERPSRSARSGAKPVTAKMPLPREVAAKGAGTRTSGGRHAAPPRGVVRGGVRVWTRGLQVSIIIALVLSPILALCVQLVRAPEIVPAAVSVVRPRALAPLLAGALANPQASAFEFSLDEINTHLAQVLLPKKEGPGWSFQRLALRLEAERCRVQTVYRWRGLDLHLHVNYGVSLQSGKFQARALSASLGRVSLGPYWTRKLEEDVLRKLLPQLRKEQVLLNRLEAIRVEPGRVILKVKASTPVSS